MGVIAGLGLTGIWFGAIWLYLAKKSGEGIFQQILALSLPDFGNFLAGAFAPVAFFWLAYSVLMQRQELRLQREELRDTRDVLKDQKTAQEESAKNSARLSDLTEKQISNQIILNKISIYQVLVDQFHQFCKKTEGEAYFLHNGQWSHLDLHKKDGQGNRNVLSNSAIFNQLQTINKIIKEGKIDLNSDNNSKISDLLFTILGIMESIHKIVQSSDLEINMDTEGFTGIMNATKQILDVPFYYEK